MEPAPVTVTPPEAELTTVKVERREVMREAAEVFTKALKVSPSYATYVAYEQRIEVPMLGPGAIPGVYQLDGHVQTAPITVVKAYEPPELPVPYSPPPYSGPVKKGKYEII